MAHATASAAGDGGGASEVVLVQPMSKPGSMRTQVLGMVLMALLDVKLIPEDDLAPIVAQLR